MNGYPFFLITDGLGKKFFALVWNIDETGYFFLLPPASIPCPLPEGHPGGGSFSCFLYDKTPIQFISQKIKGPKNMIPPNPSLVED